ncbi:ANTAR domain-containing protein [Streptomyces sp. LE64]|uniref:ANTAR domain-containing protein n=1 Tax=Streptomyces sp. LE64 TaxID=3448653 RepID=UPI0040414F81
MSPHRIPLPCAQVVLLPEGAGALWVLHLAGPVSAPEWEAVAASRPGDCVAVVLDLSATAAGPGAAGVPPVVATALDRFPGRLIVIGARPDGWRPAGTVSTAASVAEAVDRCRRPRRTHRPPPGSPGAPVPLESGAVDGPLHHLVRKMRARTAVAQAQGVLQGRYAIGAADALELLKAVAQRHNLKLRHLASAVVVVKAPPTHGPWFPGRGRRPTPPVPLGERRAVALTNHTEVLSASLRRAAELTGAPTGLVRLVDPLTGGLVVEAHLGDESAALETHRPPGEDGVRAARPGVPVTVLDTSLPGAEAPWGRTRHGVALVDGGGRFLGDLSVFRPGPHEVLAAPAARGLCALGRGTGAWLTWHHRTIVLDALEGLHARAVALTAGP